MLKRKIAILLCVILLLPLLSACGSEELRNTVAQLRGEITKLKAETVYENRYLGLTFTVPEGWWLYDVNDSAFGPDSGNPDTWAREIFGGANDFYMDMLYIGSQRDTTRTEHASFMVFLESFPDMESLEDFANLTAMFYDGTDEDNYTSTNYGLEPLTHNGTMYYRADFETTHPDNTTSILAHYYVCQVQGLYLTVYIDYWEGEAAARDAALAIFDSLTVSKGAQPDI